jgi:hypothetical protein
MRILWRNGSNVKEKKYSTRAGCVRACNWVEGSVTLASRNRVIDTSADKRKMCNMLVCAYVQLGGEVSYIGQPCGRA